MRSYNSIVKPLAKIGKELDSLLAKLNERIDNNNESIRVMANEIVWYEAEAMKSISTAAKIRKLIGDEDD